MDIISPMDEETEDWHDDPGLEMAARMLGAALNGDLDGMQAAIEAGADIGAMDEDGNTALHLAVKAGYTDLAEALLVRGLDINTPNDEGDTPLLLTVCCEDPVPMLTHLLKNGADLNHGNQIGCRVVHYAAGEENMPLLKHLVETLKVDVKHQNIDRMTPLACAVFQDRLEAARYLCEFDPSLLQITDGNGDFPLHLAVVEGRHRLVEMLLQHCTDPNMKNDRGETAQFLASQQNDTAMVKLINDAKLSQTATSAKKWWDAAEALLNAEQWDEADDKYVAAESYFREIGDESNAYWAFVKREDAKKKRKAVEGRLVQRRQAEDAMAEGKRLASRGQTREAKEYLQKAGALFKEAKDLDAAAAAATVLHQYERKGVITESTVIAPTAAFTPSADTTDGATTSGGGAESVGGAKSKGRFLGDDSTSGIVANANPSPLRHVGEHMSDSGDSQGAFEHANLQPSRAGYPNDLGLLLSLLQANSCALASAVLEQAGGDGATETRTVCRVMHSDGFWSRWVAPLMACAVDSSDEYEDLLDDEALPRLMWEASTMMEQAHRFVSQALGPAIVSVLSHKKPLELDPARTKKKKRIAKNSAALRTAVSDIVTGLSQAQASFPAHLSSFLYGLRHASQQTFPDAGLTLLHSFLFDRFICAAILEPHTYGILPEAPSSSGQRSLSLLAAAVGLTSTISSDATQSDDQELVNGVLGEFLPSQFRAVQMFMTQIATKKHAAEITGRGDAPLNSNERSDLQMVGRFIGKCLSQVCMRVDVLVPGSSAQVSEAFTNGGPLSSFLGAGQRPPLSAKSRSGLATNVLSPGPVVNEMNAMKNDDDDNDDDLDDEPVAASTGRRGGAGLLGMLRGSKTSGDASKELDHQSDVDDESDIEQSQNGDAAAPTFTNTPVKQSQGHTVESRGAAVDDVEELSDWDDDELDKAVDDGAVEGAVEGAQPVAVPKSDVPKVESAAARREARAAARGEGTANKTTTDASDVEQPRQRSIASEEKASVQELDTALALFRQIQDSLCAQSRQTEEAMTTMMDGAALVEKMLKSLPVS